MIGLESIFKPDTQKINSSLNLGFMEFNIQDEGIGGVINLIFQPGFHAFTVKDPPLSCYRWEIVTVDG